MEARDKEQNRQAQLWYQFEIEANKAVCLRQLELSSQETHTSASEVHMKTFYFHLFPMARF